MRQLFEIHDEKIYIVPRNKNRRNYYHPKHGNMSNIQNISLKQNATSKTDKHTDMRIKRDGGTSCN